MEQRREGTKTLPEQDLRALYQAQHCESHKISKQQKAKRQSSKSVAICTIPNCVYLWQIHTPKKGLHDETSQMGRVWPYWNQLAYQRKDLEEIKRNRKSARCCIATILVRILQKSWCFSLCFCKENGPSNPLSVLVWQWLRALNVLTFIISAGAVFPL